MDLSSIFEFLYSKKFLIILATVSLFLGITFYVYSNYIAPKLNPDYVPNKEFIQQGSEGEDGDSGLGKLADIYFIHAPWCPYSKKVKPTWDQIKEEYDGKNINNYTLKFFDINGEKEEKKLKEFEKTYNKQIDGYPTICIVKDNQVIEFEAKPDKNTLEEFINTVL